MTRFTVNDVPVHYRLPPDTPLLWALRDASNLTGTKYGCGVGLCGACTVHIDGAAKRSCQVTIGAIEGSFVTTIEGLSRERDHPAQAAWIVEQVPQCGYCQSGMIMAAAALLKTNPSPFDGRHRDRDHQPVPLRDLSAHRQGDRARGGGGTRRRGDRCRCRAGDHGSAGGRRYARAEALAPEHLERGDGHRFLGGGDGARRVRREARGVEAGHLGDVPRRPHPKPAAASRRP